MELCDDGNKSSNDGCSSACVPERCGDGIPQTAPAVTSIDFEWLATSCTTPRTIDFTIDGVLVLSTPGDTQTCSCAPLGGFQSITITDPSVLALVANGPSTFGVDYSGVDQFLGWALVTVHTGAIATPVVVFEDPPGSAIGHATSLCTNGFDTNVPPQTVIGNVAVGEQCDDGNLDDTDGCHNNCTVNP